MRKHLTCLSNRCNFGGRHGAQGGGWKSRTQLDPIARWLQRWLVFMVVENLEDLLHKIEAEENKQPQATTNMKRMWMMTSTILCKWKVGYSLSMTVLYFLLYFIVFCWLNEPSTTYTIIAPTNHRVSPPSNSAILWTAESYRKKLPTLRRHGVQDSYL
jgi:hypothetical protein